MLLLTFGYSFILIIAASFLTHMLANGFSVPSALHPSTGPSKAQPICKIGSYYCRNLQPLHGGPYTMGKTVIHEDDVNHRTNDADNTVTKPSSLSSSSSSSAQPVVSDRKAQLRLDGLEPYVLVSAITATASFDVVTGGNIFESPIWGNGWEEDCFRSILLLTSTISSALGMYALGIFSFSIMYSKAALSREEDASHEVYKNFIDSTASYRWKGYQAFMWSLILLVLDLFLFALAYLPEAVQPFAALVAAPIIYTTWQDWQVIISSASIIYAPIEEDDEA